MLRQTLDSSACMKAIGKDIYGKSTPLP